MYIIFITPEGIRTSKQPLSNGGISFGINKVILFTTGLLISSSVTASEPFIRSLCIQVFSCCLFVNTLLSLQWAVMLKKGLFNWQAERYQHPGEFIKPTANELGSANAFERMSVWKASGPCVVLALKNETDFEQHEMHILFLWMKVCVREEEIMPVEEWRS